ncbi:LytR/AlgR family response regulator transcription factor [Lacrimispora indolis]|uniref:LytR/AlgR family response regulator transcription factor n=1 Tax=Lacrimispora indolis TaxID=69825 RepID=UPI00042659F2|nr:LytTR family DNA-binding domain-containing protein [[Clostridium] methoxybenzovorans]
MIKIAICDDDRFICSQVEDIIINYSKLKCIKINTDVFYSGESILNYLNQGNSFDLIYLDIELGKTNGIEVGQQLRKIMKNYTTEIVYISGKDQYYKQLFDVQPLNFIEKPIRHHFVISALELTQERMQKSAGLFQYQKGYEIYKTKISDILYFESLNRKVKIVTTKQEDLFYGNLDNVSIYISSYPFLKIHRSYLINYNHASVLKYSEVVMSNGTVLPISRNRRQEIRNLHINGE